MNPKVGIVIVNWNKPQDSLRMLDSLSVLDYDNFEIFVVDNASTDDSVERIKQHPLEVDLLVNSENLGGTGGFNSGIRFALSAVPCKYVWLLDNDAIVEPGALVALVDAMESDPSVGLAGSRVLNAENSEYIVETGATFDWSNGTVRPLERNTLRSSSESSEIIDVDYVAVCSALVRVSALIDVGLMDERYFLFWDDMDWGGSFQDSGYRVVGVPVSVVLHPAFTEYRSVVVDSFYGVRNQLLTFSKFRSRKGAQIGMFHMLRRVAKMSLLMMLTHKPGGVLGLFGYWDFLRGKWGKISWAVPSSSGGTEGAEVPLAKTEKILVVPTRDVANTAQLINYLTLKGVYDIDILVSEDRKELFSVITGCRLVLVDYTRGKAVLNSLVMFMKLAFGGYDYSIKSSQDKISPFTFSIRKSAVYDAEENRVIATRESVLQVWKVFLAAFLGEVAGTVMFLLAWLRGLTLVGRKN
jgi:GT2 family glycosyltransferase